MTHEERSTSLTLGIIFALVMCFFIWRSFFGMRIASESAATTGSASVAGVTPGE